MLLPTKSLVNWARFLQIKGFGRLTHVIVLSEYIFFSHFLPVWATVPLDSFTFILT